MITELTKLESAKSVAFVIPGNPTPWQRPGQGASGQRYDKQRDKKREIAWPCKDAMQGTGGPLSGPVVMRVYFYFPRPKSGPRKNAKKFPYPDCIPDVDNCCKLIADGVNGIAWDDDAQVVELYARKLYALERNEARTVVMITEIPKRKGK